MNASRAENTLRVAVSDNGPGVPEEISARIFQHGFTTIPAGNGLGLHYSATNALEMGGSLKLQADGVENGATFVLEVPCDHVSGRSEQPLPETVSVAR